MRLLRRSPGIARPVLLAALAVAAVLLALGGPALAQSDAVAHGRYLATLGDCAVCHTAAVAGSKPFAGGHPLHSRFGTVVSANITPDRDTGIGAWTAAQFYRALHDGIDADGDHLYPAFPYPYFSQVSRADSDAIFAYLKTVPAVHNAPRTDRLPFPLDLRWLVTFWNALFYPQTLFHPDPRQGAAYNRGGELVHGLGHCGGCHTPKNIFFSDEKGKTLQGELIDGWYAPNLTGDPRTGLGRWSIADIEQFLKTGNNRFGRVVGSMAPVVAQSSSRWSDADRHAVAVYLKSLLPVAGPKPHRPTPAAMADGEALFQARCGACHLADKRDYPDLAGNSVVLSGRPETVLRVILQGSQSIPAPQGQVGFSMPAFAALDDRQVADVATYIRNAWGNRAGAVGDDEVADFRRLLGNPD